jgi:hypothetical protein
MMMAANVPWIYYFVDRSHLSAKQAIHEITRTDTKQWATNGAMKMSNEKWKMTLPNMQISLL